MKETKAINRLPRYARNDRTNQMNNTTKHKTKILKPKLRFKEFDGEWEKKKLGDIGKVKMCKRVFSNQTNDSGDIPFFKIGTFGKEADAYITEELYLQFKNKYSFPKIGDILMSASGTLGRTVIYDGVDAYFQDSNIVWLDNNEKLVTNAFLFYIYQIVRYDSEGGTIQRLYNSIISSAKFCRPKLPEQQKIANFLTAVDTKLQQLTTKKEKLAQYKKGVMQQLFSQQLRFKPNNTNASVTARHEAVSSIGTQTQFPDWEFPHANILFKSISDKKHNSDLPILAITQDQGAIPREMINYQMVVTDKSVASYKVVQVGDFIISLRSFQGGIEYSNYKGICSPAYNILRPTTEKVNKEFYKRYLKTDKYIRQLQSKLEGIRDGKMISFKYFSEIKLPFPCNEEQQKIANYLRAIDKKIETVQTQITKTQQFKKGLLQQLFV